MQHTSPFCQVYSEATHSGPMSVTCFMAELSLSWSCAPIHPHPCRGRSPPVENESHCPNHNIPTLSFVS